MTQRERRIQRLWTALEDEGLDALVVAGKGLIGQYGALEWCAGYVPVVRGAYAVLTPGARAGARGDHRRRRLVRAAQHGPCRRTGGGTGRHPLRVRRPGLGGRRARAAVRAGSALPASAMCMSSWEAERLAAALPGVELVDVSAQVGAVKAVKDRRTSPSCGRRLRSPTPPSRRASTLVAPGASGLGAERRDRARRPYARHPRRADLHQRRRLLPRAPERRARPRRRPADGVRRDRRADRVLDRARAARRASASSTGSGRSSPRPASRRRAPRRASSSRAAPRAIPRAPSTRSPKPLASTSASGTATASASTMTRR